MKFELNILGCGSATPSSRHLPSCQVLNFRERLLMIDCGEGAQTMMRRMGLNFTRLTDIFISHLHADHVFGLPGLLSTMALHGRQGTVTIHCFRAGREVLRPYIDFFLRESPFEIVWHDITTRDGIILDTPALTVETFPLYHRIPATGFIFREKPGLRHLRPEARTVFDVPVRAIADIKAGADFVRRDGTVIPNDRLTTPADPTVSYAYCSDTMASQKVAESVEGVKVLYHEATYLHELAIQARARGHSTAREAAEIALKAHARCLVIGHYSKRYNSTEPLLAEARAIFPDTIAADEGMCLNLRNLAECGIKGL